MRDSAHVRQSHQQGSSYRPRELTSFHVSVRTSLRIRRLTMFVARCEKCHAEARILFDRCVQRVMYHCGKPFARLAIGSTTEASLLSAPSPCARTTSSPKSAQQCVPSGDRSPRQQSAINGDSGCHSAARPDVPAYSRSRPQLTTQLATDAVSYHIDQADRHASSPGLDCQSMQHVKLICLGAFPSTENVAARAR